MTTAKLIEIVVMEGIAVVMFAAAYFLGVKGKMELIAGYNDKTANRVKDKPGLKRLVTRLIVLVAVASALMPLITYLFSNTPCGVAYAAGGFGGFIIGVVGIILLQAREYVE